MRVVGREIFRLTGIAHGVPPIFKGGERRLHDFFFFTDFFLAVRAPSEGRLGLESGLGVASGGASYRERKR